LRDRRRDHKRGPFPLAVVGALGFVVVEAALWTPFPFSLAISQADVDQVRRLSAVFGPAGITALMVAFAGTILDVLAQVEARQRSRNAPRVRVRPFAIYALVFALVVVGSRRREGSGPSTTITVGVVQPNHRVDLRLDLRGRMQLLDALQRATASLEARGADLVVWSEAVVPFELPRELTADLPENNRFRLRRGFTVPVVVGAATALRDGTQWNSALMLERDGRFTGRHDKVHRMIGSEYNPLLEWFPSAHEIMPAGAGSYAGGDGPVILETTVDGVAVRLAVAVCLEDVLPDFGRELAALEPDLLVNLTNDSWFGGAEPLQHEALARYRPVEMGVPMVRAVNTGPSSVIDRDGRFVARLGIREDGGEPETLLADVVLRPRAISWYAGFGGTAVKLAAWGALAWWLIPAVIAWFRRRRRVVA
jgi:apolipoprotein N-acyltransferase